MAQENKIAIPTKSEFYEPLKERMLKLVDEETFLKEISFAVQLVSMSKKLQTCEPTSILRAVYNVSTTGLSLNPVLKFASLVPRWNSKMSFNEAVLEPQYQGLVKLITDTGSAKTVYAHCVYEGDEFDVSFGTQQEIIHKPKFISKNITHSYAVSILKDGTKQIEVIPKTELEFIRGMSESYKAYIAKKTDSCIWIDHEGEMCKKTAVKRIVKYLPKTDQYARLAEAIDLDNQDYSASDEQCNYLYTLLDSSVYDPETREVLEMKIKGGLSLQEFSVMKADLQNNQIDPVTQRGSYSQTDLKNHLAKL